VTDDIVVITPDAVDSVAPSKRPMIDMDEMMKADLEKATAALEVEASMRIFGTEVRVIQPSNSFNLIAMSRADTDPGVLGQIMVDMVHPDDRVAFLTAVQHQPVLSADMLLMLLNNMMEAVGLRPTGPSPDSLPTQRGRKSARS